MNDEALGRVSIPEGIRRAQRLQQALDGINTLKSTEKPAERRTAPIIGISGFMGAGKDALADILVSKHGFEKTFMSEPLARALYTLNPWIPVESPAVQLTMRYRHIVDDIGYTEAKKIPEVRRLLQVLGTEVGRDIIGESTWTDIAARTLTQWQEQGIPAVITGIRYRNELEMIEQLGGVTVWIDRPGLVIPAELATHSSETTVGPDACDYLVINSGTLEDLAKRAETLMLEVDG